MREKKIVGELSSELYNKEEIQVKIMRLIGGLISD